MLKQIINKKYIVSVVVASLVFSFFMLIGGFSYYQSINLLSTNPSDILYNFSFFVMNFFIFCGITVGISLLLILYKKILSKTPALQDAKYIFVLFPILLLVYGGIYFLYFPGIVGYDTYMQIPQALGKEPYTLHHPFFHTLLIKLCLALGDIFPYKGSGIIIYSVIQIIILCVCITYVVYMVHKTEKNIISLILTTLWYGAYPTFALFSFNMTKDVLFSAFFCIFIIKMFFLIKDRSSQKKDYIITSVFGVLSCLFRNNAVYVMLASLIMFFFLKINKKVLISIMVSVITYILVNNVVLGGIIGLKAPNQEKLSIPIQQIATVSTLSPELIDDETYALIEEYLPLHRKLYNMSTVDFVKALFNNEKYEENKLSFWKLWVNVGLKSPIAYFKAGILLNLESWYPYYIYKDQYYYTDYICTKLESSLITEDILTKVEYLPEVKKVYDDFSTYDLGFMNKKILGFIFSLSFPFLFLFQLLIQCIAQAKYKAIYVLVPLLLLWASHLLGPLSNIRYFLPILLFVPIGITLFINDDKIETL